MASEQFSLSWDNFHQNMSSGMNSLLENEDLVDVTLAVEGKYLKAHKMVLSVCSPYFKELFKTNPCKHPIVFMKDVSYVALSDLLQFMYQGEVQVSQENLTTFIKTAEALQIKGLTGDGNGAADDANETTHEERHQPEVPITVPRPKKLPPPPAMSTPAPKRQRLSSSVESPAVHHQEMKVTAKTEPMSSSGVSSGSDQLIQFKMEPYPDTTGGGSSMVDDGQDDTFGEEGLDDSTQIQDDGEEYAMMEGGDEEPQAGTSSETAGEGQGCLRKQDKSDEVSKNKSPLFHDARELECLLKETAEGREILDSYRSRQLSLTPQHRTKLVSIIINNEIKENPDSCISQRRFIQLSNQIVKIFPGENKNIYYAPFCKMGNTGKTVAKGKLLYRYNLVKQQVEKINPPIVSKKPNPPKLVKIVDKNPDDISWLKSNTSPWSEVILKWSKTTKNRLEHYASDDSTIADYLTTYPALQDKDGHKLFEIDFKNLFPDKERKLIEMLPKLSKKIFILAGKSDRKEIRSYLNLINENSSEDSRNAVCFLLLSHLMPPPPVHAARHTWRPTPEECCDNFLLHAQSPKVLRGALARRSRRCRLLGVGCQPLAAVVGDLGNGDTPLQALVRVNSNLYRCGDVAECVDVCYKLFHCLNADYPPQSSHVWHFLQHYVYGMTTIFDQEFKCVKELVKQLDDLDLE